MHPIAILKALQGIKSISVGQSEGHLHSLLETYYTRWTPPNSPTFTNSWSTLCKLCTTYVVLTASLRDGQVDSKFVIKWTNLFASQILCDTGSEKVMGKYGNKIHWKSTIRMSNQVSNQNKFSIGEPSIYKTLHCTPTIEK
jgi:hypothetical protein